MTIDQVNYLLKECRDRLSPPQLVVLRRLKAKLGAEMKQQEANDKAKGQMRLKI